MEHAIEKRVMSKLFWRLTPLLMLMYIIAYVDRVNVGFAALTMNKAIGLDAYTYGLGAGIFFVGYFIFEVPSNLILAKVGARKWIARILLTWGMVATAMAWVQGPNSFLAMRFLLGVAEAGFFPGVILYLTYWFPARYRARIISRFMLAIPLSLAVGAPISTWIMELDGALGYQGWQWLFILEGVPAMLLPFAVWKYMPDGPHEASWLNEEEKRWITKELASDGETVAVSKVESSVKGVFTNPMVWAFCFIYFVSTTTNYGLSMFMPQIIKQLGFSTMQTGFVMFVPYIIGCAGMLVIGYLSDRNKERKWHLIASCLMIAIGLGVAGWCGNTIWAIVAMCFAAIGIMGFKGPFWPLPSAYLSGAGAAAGIALINSVGNLGGFAGPWAVGLAKQMTGSFSSGLYALAAVALAGAFLTFFVVKVKKQQAEPEA
ncbi:MAG: MFS transporter [Negativicutes bacterium]|nr:MFS transporter [Negativicutes bacterium]